MNEPLVSVVMPTYNHESFIGEAVDSVLNQTYQNLELIVVDNESKDNTSRILSSYRDRRVKYIRCPNNGTIAAPRNFGIQQTTGKYIAFIDSDDVWLPGKLTAQIAALESNGINGISFCKFKVLSPGTTDHGKIIGPKTSILPENLYERLIKANFIVSSSAVVLKKAIEDVGGFDEDPELRCSEDFDLWLRITRKYKAAYVNEVAGIYRMHGTNQSANDLRLKRALAVIDKHFHKGWINQHLADKARASFYFQVGWVLIGEDPRLGRSHCKKAFYYDYTNPRIILVSLLGIGLSYIPGLYKIIKNNKIDKKISRRTINPQNL
ncbi:MAG: glycosyltransferase family 2 protein [Candidatus Omnitrophota bacterium]